MLSRSLGARTLNKEREGLPREKSPSRVNVDVSNRNSIDAYDEVPNFKTSKVRRGRTGYFLNTEVSPISVVH
jgi:hypothetical protein